VCSNPRHHVHHRERWWVALLLVCHLVLGVYYSVVIPIWEAHDEIGHYAKVRYIATERRLPPPGATTAPIMDETHQPPLYYLLAAVPVMALPLEESLAYRANPYVGYADAQGGHNVAIHHPSSEAWPYRGDVLGVHLARWVSVLLGAIVVLLVYASARALWPQRALMRWSAALFVAAWPQFRFSTAVVNNDIAAMLASSVMLYGLVLWLRGYETVRSGVWLALGMGMLALAKTNGLPILAVGALGLAIGSRRRLGDLWLSGLVAALGIAIVLAAWWYLRNVQATGRLIGGPWSTLGDLLAGRDGPDVAGRSGLEAGSWLHALRTFWAGFGQNNVAYPDWVYGAAVAIVMPPLAGMIAWASERRPSDQVTAVMLACLMVMAAVVVPQVLWALRGWTHVQGRYLLPSLPALALLLGLGWSSLGERLALHWLSAVPVGAMIALVSVTPLCVIQPAYAYPRVPTSVDLAAIPSSQYRFGQSIDLVGWRVVTLAVDPGDTFRSELVWRALKPTWTPLVLSAKLRDGEGRLLAEVTRFPGNGSLATDTWEPGLYLDELSMSIPEGVAEERHQQLWLDVSLYPRWDAESPLAVFQEGLGRIGRSLRLGPAKLRGANDDLSGLSAVRYTVGDGLTLRGLAGEYAHGAIVVRSGWRAEVNLQANLHVSLQVRDAAGEVVAQDDGPLGEDRLPTSLWEAGDEFLDRRSVVVPDRESEPLRVYLCVYELASMQRWGVSREGESVGSELCLGELGTEGDGFEAFW